MNSERFFPFTQESEAELQRVRTLAEALGVRFDEIVRAGSQGTTIGIQSKSVLFSLRLDSRTFFVHDTRFGPGAELGVLEASDDEYIKAAHEILNKLEIPHQELALSSVQQEQAQIAEFNRETGEARFDPVMSGKRYVTLTRQIDGLPVWSSRVLLGLTKDRQIGFLEAHWPEIPQAAIAEAKRLANRMREGWSQPEKPLAKVIEVQAGIIHSPAAGFVMDIYPAIRVIYASTDERIGKRAVEYFDRHGKPVPIPRQFDLPPEKVPTGRVH